jgi:hypothetical protein
MGAAAVAPRAAPGSGRLRCLSSRWRWSACSPEALCPVSLSRCRFAFLPISGFIYAYIKPHTIGTEQFIETLVGPMSPPCACTNGLWSD